MARITLEFLQKIISDFDSDVIVSRFQETHGSGRGDNYTAMLYRLKLEGHRFNKDKNTKEPWRKSLIYKCLPDNYARREAFKSDILFKNEVAFYTTVMPVLMKYQLSKGSLIKQFNSLPNCYYAKSDLLVLEDMCVKGFKMADRKLGINYEECSAVLKELAKYHGLSLAYKIEHPNAFKKLLEDKNSIQESYFIKENAEWYRSYYKAVRQNAVGMVQDALGNTNRENEKYIKKFKDFTDDLFYYRMMSLVRPVEPLSVFCHGDCWTNNILFSTLANGKIDKVCFVDFQLCRYASPALDLANLLYCCTTRQLRDQKLDTLINEYFITLYNFLQDILDPEVRINCEFIQKDSLRLLIQKEFKRCGLFGLGLALDMIPISTCDSEQAPDLYDEDHEENIEQSGAFPVESNESCKRKMVNLVCELVDQDVL